MEENDRIQSVSIRALAHLAETRDPETGNHILRTSRMFSFWQRGCRRTFDSATRSRITTSCCWADRHHRTISGKVGIPDSIH